MHQNVPKNTLQNAQRNLIIERSVTLDNLKNDNPGRAIYLSGLQHRNYH